VLAAGRSPPEIAYQLGELLHNHFRTRGVTLTSYELRRLVGELLMLQGRSDKEPSKSEAEPSTPQPVVSFEREAKTPWPGDLPPDPLPEVPDKALEPPPSPIVSVTPRDERVAMERREVAGLGPIDRFWADLAVRAIFVNGPQSVFVERDGALEAVEGFRDAEELGELATRLAGTPESGIAGFHLRDGSIGFVIFPPVAPAGPVLTLRRAEPGQATLEGLVSVGMLDRRVAELLRLCVRSRLNVLVAGPAGSGKTVLLMALIRDLDSAHRVATVASHRHFQASSRVELVAQAAAPFAVLIEAAARLDPGVLVLDGVPPEAVPALSDRLRVAALGTLAAIRPELVSDLARAVDVVVRTDCVDGQPRVVAVEDSAGAPAFLLEGGKLVRAKPAFAATLQARGAGESLAKLLG
jgi:type IV secretory pathway ATPase VirB11/archaellum biosynthesis ATPase